LVGGLDGRIYDVRVHRRYSDSYAAKVLGWNTALELFPGRSSVGRFVESTFGAAVQKRIYMTPPLVGRGIDYIRIAGIERHIGDSGVFAYGQDVFPGLAAVSRLEQAPIAAGSPQRPLGRHIDGVCMLRINRDASDVLGMFQTDVGPALAAVVRAVNSVAVGY